MRVKKVQLYVLLIIPGIMALSFYGYVTFVSHSAARPVSNVVRDSFWNWELPRSGPHETETRDLAEYSKSLASWKEQWDPKWVGHFPTEIPSSASLKRFFRRDKPGLNLIQLRLRLPPSQIRERHSQFLAQRTNINERTTMPPLLCINLGANDDSFPTDYQVIILGKALTPAYGGGPNHGRIRGVGISTSRNEIVYWTSIW